MNDQPSLFDALPAEEAREEPWWVRSPVTSVDRQRAKIWRGRHPLSGVHSTGPLGLHSDESLTCGGCQFFERHRAQGESVWPRDKCVFGAARREDGTIAAAPRFLAPAPGEWCPPVFEGTEQDLYEWFRACTDYEPAEAGR